jgi:hypothetical protein
MSQPPWTVNGAVVVEPDPLRVNGTRRFGAPGVPVARSDQRQA